MGVHDSGITRIENYLWECELKGDISRTREFLREVYREHPERMTEGDRREYFPTVEELEQDCREIFRPSIWEQIERLFWAMMKLGIIAWFVLEWGKLCLRD